MGTDLAYSLPAMWIRMDPDSFGSVDPDPDPDIYKMKRKEELPKKISGNYVFQV